MAIDSQARHLLDDLRRQRVRDALPQGDDFTTDSDPSIEEGGTGAVFRATHLGTERLSDFRSRIA